MIRKFFKKSTLLLSVTLFLSIGAVSISGQTVSGTLRGTVTDTNGAAVPNATVVVRSTETGLERTATTSDDGNYNFPFVPIGRYTVSATRTDFNRVLRENVSVNLNETAVVNVRLDPTVSGEVTISDDGGAPINTSDQQIASSLSRVQIEDRPVANQGNFLTLAETFTGFQENPTSGQNNPTASSGSSINFNGTGTRGATFQINGVNNDDSSENQNRQGASLATIKEFQVISNNFTAEFGRGYGAVVLVQTLNGTNDFKGSAYWYHNDQALNAKSFFSHSDKAVFRRNQFGGVLGFPIFKNKLFGFASVDEVRRTGEAGYTRDLFLDYEKNPANWFQINPENDTPANRAFIQSVIDRFAGLTPNDPANRSPRTYVGTTPQIQPANDYSFRLDWNATPKDTLFARWQYTRQIFNTNDVVIGEQAIQNHKQQNWGLTWTHIFSNNIVGEFRYGLGQRSTLVNIQAGNDTPIIRFPNNPYPAVSGSIIGNAGGFPIQRWQTDNQFVYNLSSVFGNHFLKAGTDLRLQVLDDLADSNSRGFWNFSSTCNGTVYRDPNTATAANPLGNPSSYLAFINGCTSAFTKGYGNFFLENRISEYNFYLEDNWKVRPNLTLNLGGRYEYVSAPRELMGRIEYGYGDDKNNVEPRFGFAYSPGFEGGFLGNLFGGPGESSFRGGYGIYHGRLFQSIFAQSGAGIRFNPPNALQRVFSNTGNVSDPSNGFVFVPGEQTARFSGAFADEDLEMPYTQQWNLTFERKMLWDSALRLSYTGNRGIGLLKFAQGNAPRHTGEALLVQDHPNNAPAALGYGALPLSDPRRTDVRGQVIRPAADLDCAGTGLTGVATNTLCPVAVPLGAFEYSRRVLRTNERRPDGRWTTNLLISNGSWSYYNGLQVEWIKRLSWNTSFSAAYTWSKSIDTTSEATFVGTGDSNQNGNDAKVSRALSRFHTPHRFTFFGSYTNPFFDKDRGVLGHVLGGWQLSGVFKWVHGTPFTVSGTGTDLNLDSFVESRPALLDPSILFRSIDNPETSQSLLPRTAFRQAQIDDFGCCILGRNTFFLDGVKNVDLSITKRFLLPWERHNFVLRADMFNAFNHVQWGFPDVNYTSATFGRLTGLATSYAPRSIQVSMKYSF